MRYTTEQKQRTSLARSIMCAQLVETQQPYLNNHVTLEEIEQNRGKLLGDDNPPKSVLFMPLLAGGKVTHYISLQNDIRENAFSESDVRLLTTLANSMSVALQNAQSFKAEQERVAELAIINSVQQGLASKLEMQAIFELVGEELRTIFTGHEIALYTFDPDSSLLYPRYIFEAGERLYLQPFAPGPIYQHMSHTGASAILSSKKEFERIGAITMPGLASSVIWHVCAAQIKQSYLRQSGGRERCARKRVQPIGRAITGNACLFNERRARKRPSLRRDPASAQRDRTARG